jgi:hypothetical protein
MVTKKEISTAASILGKRGQLKSLSTRKHSPKVKEAARRAGRIRWQKHWERKAKEEAERKGKES